MPTPMKLVFTDEHEGYITAEEPTSPYETHVKWEWNPARHTFTVENDSLNYRNALRENLHLVSDVPFALVYTLYQDRWWVMSKASIRNINRIHSLPSVVYLDDLSTNLNRVPQAWLQGEAEDGHHLKTDGGRITSYDYTIACKPHGVPVILKQEGGYAGQAYPKHMASVLKYGNVHIGYSLAILQSWIEWKTGELVTDVSGWLADYLENEAEEVEPGVLRLNEFVPLISKLVSRELTIVSGKDFNHELKAVKDYIGGFAARLPMHPKPDHVDAVLIGTFKDIDYYYMNPGQIYVHEGDREYIYNRIEYGDSPQGDFGWLIMKAARCPVVHPEELILESEDDFFQWGEKVPVYSPFENERGKAMPSNFTTVRFYGITPIHRRRWEVVRESLATF